MKNWLGVPPYTLYKLVQTSYRPFLIFISQKSSTKFVCISSNHHTNLTLITSTLVVSILFKGKYLFIAILALCRESFTILQFEWICKNLLCLNLILRSVTLKRNGIYTIVNTDLCWHVGVRYTYMYVFEVQSSRMLLSVLKRFDILLEMQWICCVLPKSVVHKKNGHDDFIIGFKVKTSLMCVLLKLLY